MGGFSEVTVYLAGTLAIAYALHWIFKGSKDVANYDKMANRPARWLLGNLLEMDGPDVFTHIKNSLMLNSKIYKNYMGTSVMVSIVHPTTLKDVIGQPKCNEKAWNYRFMAPWLGKNSMLIHHDDTWHKSRRYLTPMFHKDLLRNYMNAYTTSAHTLINKMKEAVRNDTFTRPSAAAIGLGTTATDEAGAGATHAVKKTKTKTKTAKKSKGRKGRGGGGGGGGGGGMFSDEEEGMFSNDEGDEGSSSSTPRANNTETVTTPETQVLDLYDTMSLLTLDLTLQAGFGHHSNCQIEESLLPKYFGAMNAQVWNRTKNPLLWPNFIYRWTDDYKKGCEYIRGIKDYMANLLKERRSELAQGIIHAKTAEGRPTDFMQHLIEAGLNDKEYMTDSMILSNVTGLIFASFDTSCIAMSWINFAFARYPDWQEKCRAEVDEVLGDETEPKYNQLVELKVLETFIKETMRMWPPVPLIGRVNATEMTTAGHTIPARSWLEIGIWGAHHNPDIWENPDVFDPSRFDEKKKIVNYSFIPFSAGPRGCLGRVFAMNELKTMTAMLLKEFVFTPDMTLPEPQIRAEIMLLCKDGLRVLATPREPVH